MKRVVLSTILLLSLNIDLNAECIDNCSNGYGTYSWNYNVPTCQDQILIFLIPFNQATFSNTS